MTQTSATLLALAAYAVILIVIAVAAARRMHSANDFLLASGRLGAVGLALGYSMAALPPWIALSLSGAAFLFGRSALWICAALLLMLIVHWFFVAPRLRTLSSVQGCTSIVQLLSGDVAERAQPHVLRSAIVIALFSLLLLIAAQVHFATSLFAARFELPFASTVIAAILIVTTATLMGGLWSASAHAVLQSLVMFVSLSLIGAVGVIALGGLDQLQIGLTQLGPGLDDWFGGRTGVVATAFTLGMAGFGFALVGQPVALAYVIAVRDDRSLKQARWISIVFVLALLSVAMLAGWCARVLFAGLNDPHLAAVETVLRLSPPLAAGVLVAFVLAAVAGAIDAQLLLTTSLFTADLKRAGAPVSLEASRVLLAASAVLTMTLVINVTGSLFEHALFAWTTLGVVFGPLLLVRVGGKRIRGGSTLGAMWAGFLLALIFHLLPDSPGDILERLVPFVATLGIALTGGERRRNPDRADRAEETVHDRVPI